jgi:hypothetical protein
MMWPGLRHLGIPHKEQSSETAPQASQTSLGCHQQMTVNWHDPEPANIRITHSVRWRRWGTPLLKRRIPTSRKETAPEPNPTIRPVRPLATASGHYLAPTDNCTSRRITSSQHKRTCSPPQSGLAAQAALTLDQDTVRGPRYVHREGFGSLARSWIPAAYQRTPGPIRLSPERGKTTTQGSSPTPTPLSTRRKCLLANLPLDGAATRRDPQAQPSQVIQRAL